MAGGFGTRPYERREAKVKGRRVWEAAPYEGQRATEDSRPCMGGACVLRRIPL